VYRDIDQYQYFIKTDLSDFYNNIDIDLLINTIDEKVNFEAIGITQTELLIYKELLLYCGRGRFPLIENSMCSSFLSTIIYLSEIDERLNEYILTKNPEIISFKMVRYVDDLYILLNVNKKTFDANKIYNRIIAQYTSILNEYNLKINVSKCKIDTTDNINNDLKTLVNYNYYYDYNDNLIVDVHSNCFTELLKLLISLDRRSELNVNNYNEAINQCFSIDEINLIPSDIYNMFVYNFSEELFKNEENVSNMISLLNNKTLISIDPRRIARLVLASKNDKLIKQMLNNLFMKDKSGTWNFHDTAVAIEYLIQSGFRHIDLKYSLFENNLKDLKRYYSTFCQISLNNSFKDVLGNKKTLITSIDNKTTFLYFMYLMEKRKNNNMLAYSYYYNYFCSLTADIDCLLKNGKKPNHRAFYQESDLKKFYNTNDVFPEAAKLRNTNPVDHASGELLFNNNRKTEMENVIDKLQDIQDVFISKLTF
jgi:AbiA family abortive infection protein